MLWGGAVWGSASGTYGAIQPHHARALLPACTPLHQRTAPPSVVLDPCQTIDSFPVLASQTARTICSPPEAKSCALTADSCMSSSWHSRTHSCGARGRAARLGYTPYRAPCYTP